jgi:glycosyltransferase involved in cell wall biosynthesis
MRAVAIVPAYQAEHTVGEVVRELRASWPQNGVTHTVLVIDDGSNDATSERATEAGAFVLRHRRNLGKGAALRTGLAQALALGADVAVSVDADGQHPAEEAVRILAEPAPPDALVLGVRDLVRDGAPRANQISNGISNFFLSTFTRRSLADTQCGLRRYPVKGTLELDAQADGYAFEAEIVMRAARARWPIAQVPVRVLYPVGPLRVSHFHVVRDPARIVARVLTTLFTAPGPRP